MLSFYINAYAYHKNGKYVNNAIKTPDGWEAFTTEDYVSVSGWYVIT